MVAKPTPYGITVDVSGERMFDECADEKKNSTCASIGHHIHGLPGDVA